MVEPGPARVPVHRTNHRCPLIVYVTSSVTAVLQILDTYRRIVVLSVYCPEV